MDIFWTFGTGGNTFTVVAILTFRLSLRLIFETSIFRLKVNL
jgi:hypothetical protein